MENPAPRSNYPVVRVNGVSKKYSHVQAVNNISFEVVDDEIFSLLGPNGAGKSVLIKTICGLIKPDAGEITINNHKPNQVKSAFGYCPQDRALYETMTVYENLYYFGKLYSVDTSTLKKRINQILESLDIASTKNKQVGILSGGQQQRVAITCSLLHDPDIIILDEPTSGLDPISKKKLWDYLTSIPKTIIYSTHSMEDAEFFSDRVAIMNQGQVLKLGSPDYLKKLIANEKVVKITSYPGVSDNIKSILSPLPFIEDVISFHGKTVIIITLPDEQKMTQVLALMQSYGEKVTDYHLSNPSLEDVFMYLVGEKWQQ